MIPPASAPSAPPLSAPCSVLGPVPTQPVSSVLRPRADAKNADLFIAVKSERRRGRLAAMSTAERVVVIAEAERNRRIPVTRIVIARGVVINHPRRGFVHHRGGLRDVHHSRRGR